MKIRRTLGALALAAMLASCGGTAAAAPWTPSFLCEDRAVPGLEGTVLQAPCPSTALLLTQTVAA